MIEPFVRVHLRQHALQALLNALGIGLVVAMLLTPAAVIAPVGVHPTRFAAAVRVMISSTAWLVAAFAILLLAVNRVSQVKERTREFAILRVLGAPFGYLAELLFQETVCVALPGTAAGIALSCANGSLLALTFRNILSVTTPFELWLPAGVIAAACFFAASLLGARHGMKLDILQALGEED